MIRTLRLGTRKSPLSLAQAHWIVTQLKALGWDVEVVPFVTTGDKILHKALADFGGKGLFTKEIEDALLEGTIDVAVHSLKDMPTILPDGLRIGATPLREDARDVWISKGHVLPTLADLPRGAVVGTSSLRRRIFLQRQIPDIKVVDLRGNIGTRLEKLNRGDIDGMVLALAAFKRLNLLDEVTQILPFEQMLPAVAQGALALEYREDRLEVFEILRYLHHEPTSLCISIERGFLRALDGSCRTPIAGHASWQGEQIFFQGFIATIEGDHTSTIKTFYDPQKDGPAEEFGFLQGKNLALHHQNR